MEKKKINDKAFVAVGVIFIGTGLTFMFAVNTVLGIALETLGIVYLFLGIRKKK